MVSPGERMENIYVLSSSDNLYAQHLGVMLTSMLENTSSQNRIEIFIIDGGISGQNKEFLNSIVAKHGRRINYLSLNPERYEGLEARSYFSLVTYFRLFIPELMDLSVEKVIYLDCDLIVRGDIAKLWDIDIGSHFVAAVEDAGNENMGDEGLALKKNLHIPIKFCYFNAGVLVINLAAWRIHNIGPKICDFIRANSEKISFCDQDGLNAVLFNQWRRLPVQWNVQTDFYELLHEKRILRADLLQALQNPQIVHYSTKSKPWRYMDSHPQKKEYYRYLKMTPWRRFVPADRTLGNIFRKTPPGKFIKWYRWYVGYFYQYDKEGFPEKLSRLFLFKLLYALFFPLGHAYLHIFCRPVRLSYFIEYHGLAPGIFKQPWLSRILARVVFPTRFMLPGLIRERIQNDARSSRKICPCCGNKSILPDTGAGSNSCNVCCWKDDPAQAADPDLEDGQNPISLRQAQKNYQDFKAADMRYLRFISKPEWYEKSVTK